MRGEHCIAGASIATAMAIIMLVFTNIAQLNPGAVTKGLYLCQIDVAAFGAAYVASVGKSQVQLYDTKNDDLGVGKGLRQVYKFGLYNACGYQTDGSGVCNSTIFGYPMEGIGQILQDLPPATVQQTLNIAGDTAFTNSIDSNHAMSRAGSLLIFVGSLACVATLIFGLFKARFFFFIAMVCSTLAAVLLMVGAALWTALIAKNAAINQVQYNKIDFGMDITAGSALYLVWVAFVLQTLATVPYTISCMTFRRQ